MILPTGTRGNKVVGPEPDAGWLEWHSVVGLIQNKATPEDGYSTQPTLDTIIQKFSEGHFEIPE
jgi:hypothetical protein